MRTKAFARSAVGGRSVVSIALVSAALACALPALAAAPAGSIIKIINGKYPSGVDNGWVVYQDQAGLVAPGLRRFSQDANGVFTASGGLKLKTVGAGLLGNGAIFNVAGITFAPCPTAAAPIRCGASDFGSQGVGLAFGQSTFGGEGAAAAGWVNDNKLTANFTDADFNNPGSVDAVAADQSNGAFAAGRTLNTTTFRNHALVMGLDSAGKSYRVLSRTDLGTLGGLTSQLTAVSKNALYAVGQADDAVGKAHAVYTLTGTPALVDITAGWPVSVLKSRAFAVSNTGIIAGSATEARLVNGVSHNVEIGFVYNIATKQVAFFESPGADTIPLKVLDDGRVIGNLGVVKAPKATGLTEFHPFMYDGTVHDFGTMQLAASPAFSCRVNAANNLGEMAGTCIPDNATPFGIQGTAFFINGVAAQPSFINVNSMLHANADASNSAIKPYRFGTVTGIDDQHEITLIGVNKAAAQAAFLASKPAYNP